MEIKVIDDFLPENEIDELHEIMIHNHSFPWYYQDKVAIKNEVPDHPWNWYQTHILYVDNQVRSPHYHDVSKFFLPRFNELRSLLRIKANFYPHTETLREHLPHTDYEFEHTAAIFSVNTCDGFTRMKDGTKIDSVRNRIVFFDGSTTHNSSTTTSAPVRWNLNFNYL